MGQSHTPATIGGTHEPHPPAVTAEENSPAAGQSQRSHTTGTAHSHISAGCSRKSTSTENGVEGAPFPGQPASPAPVEGAISPLPQRRAISYKTRPPSPLEKHLVVREVPTRPIPRRPLRLSRVKKWSTNIWL